MLEILLEHSGRMLPVYACAAVGGLVAERSGVMHLGLEAVVMSCALTASLVAIDTGSFALAALTALSTGALIGWLHGALVTRWRVDAVVSGFALNMAATAGCRAFLRAAYGSSSNGPAFRGEGAPVWLWAGAALALALAVRHLLQNTRFGAAVRAVGSAPDAARSAGLDVARVRTVAVVLGSAIAGLSGLAIVYDQHQFQAGISGGRGFVALVIGIVARRRPLPAFALALSFALLEGLDTSLQGVIDVPSELLSALPYLATLLALALARRKGADPFAPI